MARSSSEQYIGGAERARREARKQMNRPPPRHNQSRKRHRGNDTRQLPFPKSMRPYDRFFGSLLASSIDMLRESQVNDRKHDELMTQCCSLLNVPQLPPVPIKTPFHKAMEQNCDARSHHLLQRTSSFLSEASFSSTSSSGTFDNARSYYMSKAPLILEESRCIIADALQRQSYQKQQGCALTMQLISVDEKYTSMKTQRQFAPLILNFRVEKVKVTEKGMSWSRPGNVFALHSRVFKEVSSRDAPNKAVLACVAPVAQNKSDDGSAKSTYISLMIFRRDELDLSELIEEDSLNGVTGKAMFQAVALTTLISQVRQMEACLRMTKVSFMPKLLGSKKSTHIRFIDSDDDEEDEDEGVIEDEELSEEEVFEEESSSSYNYKASLEDLMAKLPKLNVTQEKAATSFLTSLPASLILVQGPPGTGKSTFLVNVICRRLMTDPNARILVTAPTNKAVTVLAQRFLDTINNMDDSSFSRVNPVLVGVEDKLVNDQEQYLSAEVMTTSLRSIFAYTWIESVKTEWLVFLDDLEKLSDVREKSGLSIESLIDRAKRMQQKLSNGIPRSSSGCRYDVNELIQKLESVAAAEIWKESMNDCLDELNIDSSSYLIDDAIAHCRNIRGLLHEIDSSDVVPELLATARVIFCTLSTAGSSILKQTCQVDDLLVDEAAAATEAEICIPFHLRPKRLLAVGDPLQLPPTIISRRAALLGLSKSMHDRLMNECDEEYFMLDQQYRMVPSISQFPCRQFYDGKITDGSNVSCETYSMKTFLPMNRPYSFIHVQGTEYKGRCGSYANNEECNKILELLQDMRTKSKETLSDWDSHDRLRVITFYQGQTSLLKSLLLKHKFNNVLVATVDSSQGCEADTVIVSFTRSNNKKGVLQAAGFLADDRRINVAITRGRHQLICVGNADTLGSEGSDALKQLVHDARQRKCIHC